MSNEEKQQQNLNTRVVRIDESEKRGMKPAPPLPRPSNGGTQPDKKTTK